MSYQRPPERGPKVFLARQCWERRPDLEEVIGALLDICLRMPDLQTGRSAWSVASAPAQFPGDPETLVFRLAFTYELAGKSYSAALTCMVSMLDQLTAEQVCPGGFGTAVSAEFVDSQAWEAPGGDETITPTLVSLDYALADLLGVPVQPFFDLVEGTYGRVTYR